MKYYRILILAVCIFPLQAFAQKQANGDAILKKVRAAIQQKPNDRLTLYRGAETLYQKRLFADCVKTVDSLVALDGGYYPAYTVRLKCRYELKDYRNALEDAIRAVELMPVLEKFGNQLLPGTAITRLDEFPFIYAIVSRHLKDDRDIFKYYGRLFDLFEAKAQDALKPLWKTTVPEMIHAKLGLLLEECARLYDRKGQSAKAEEVLEHLIQTYPRWHGYTRRAAYYASKKRYSEAVDDLTKSLTLVHPERFQTAWLLLAAPIPPLLQWRGETLRWRGDLYAFLKKFDRAVADYEAAKTYFLLLKPNPDRAESDRLFIEKLLAGIDRKIRDASAPAKKTVKSKK